MVLQLYKRNQSVSVKTVQSLRQTVAKTTWAEISGSTVKP